MGVNKGYKQTVLGEIPNDWIDTTFENVLDGFSSGMTPYRGNPEFYTGDIRWITSGELNYNTIYDTIEKITEEAVKKTNLKLLPPGTFLMAITGLEAAGTRGSCAIVGAESTTNQSCMALFPTKKMSTEYLYQFYIKYGNYLAFNYCQGTKQQSYTAKIVKKLPIVLPLTKEEQQAIAQALNDTDALIEALEKLIEKKHHIKQGAMQELLTGKRRLPGFEVKKGYKQTELGEIPEDWEVVTIENVCTISTGSKNTQDRVYNGKYPFFVRSQTIERINSYTYDKEAVLTAGDGVGTGKVFHYINGKFDVHQRVYVMTDFRVVDGYFFYLYFSNNFYDRISQMTAKSSVDSVRREMIADMLMPIPATEEQQAIATVLSDMDSEIEALENKLQKIREIKNGMMHELLTGKIRLLPSENEVS